MDRNHIKTIKQIFPKSPFAKRLPEVAVRRRYHANIGSSRPRLPHPLIFSFLQQAQKFGLNLQRKLADLVKKEGSAFRSRHLSLRIGKRPRKCAFHMAK